MQLTTTTSSSWSSWKNMQKFNVFENWLENYQVDNSAFDQRRRNVSRYAYIFWKDKEA